MIPLFKQFTSKGDSALEACLIKEQESWLYPKTSF